VVSRFFWPSPAVRRYYPSCMQDSVTVQVNGERRLVPISTCIPALLALLAIKPERVAVEVNRRIVKRTLWEETVLSEGDKVEIVQFVGGG
jgi:thiamine biosynthesis protein ThiS